MARREEAGAGALAARQCRELVSVCFTGSGSWEEPASSGCTGSALTRPHCCALLAIWLEYLPVSRETSGSLFWEFTPLLMDSTSWPRVVSAPRTPVPRRMSPRVLQGAAAMSWSAAPKSSSGLACAAGAVMPAVVRIAAAVAAMRVRIRMVPPGE